MTDVLVPARSCSDILLSAEAVAPVRRIWLAGTVDVPLLADMTPQQQAWLGEVGFAGKAKEVVLVPGAGGTLAGAVLGIGNGRSGEPVGPGELLTGHLARTLPAGTYELAGPIAQPELAAIAFGLGGYSFTRYKTTVAATPGSAPSAGPGPASAVRLRLPPQVDRERVMAIVDAVWLARDLINTPASDMGPQELEAAVRSVGARNDAAVSAVVGEELLTQGFPMIHAVGRASTRAPRLLDLTWGRQDAPRVTLVGKGICFDTGGLDLKPAAGMLLMKKDMGGAATALALGAMIMALRLDVRLRVLIPAAENSVAGNAFRPQDVITTRDGRTVEIGNTDAEGRLVLSDALSLADQQAPDMLLTFSTLTGAARVALGPDLPPCYSDDVAFAGEIAAAGQALGDPVWHMPFWQGYERNLDSDVADMSNVSEGPFAGSITAALFLRRFVKKAHRFAHFDIYGWRPAHRPLGPKGGEPQVARAVLAVLEARYGRIAG